MKSKQFVFLLSILMVSSGSIFAQSLFVRLAPGIALAAITDDVGQATVIGSGGQTQTVVYGSNGSGFVAGADIGFMFNENIGAQLGIEYLAGSKLESNTVEGNNISSSLTFQSSQWRLSPEVIVQATPGKFTPYARVGVSIPLATKTIETRMEEDSLDNFEVVNEYQSGTSLGYRGAIGVKHNLKSRISVFLEAGGLSQRVRVTESVITKLDVNGASQLENRTTFDLEKNFVDVITESSNSMDFTPDIDADQPEDRAAFDLNFSSFILKAGIVIQF